MHRQTFKTTLSEGGGEGKHFCDYDCVSIPGKEEISTRFWFVSTSFVRGCRHFKKHKGSFTSKNTRSPKTAKISVVAQCSEQVKAYDCYKRLIIKRKVQVLFIEKAQIVSKTQDD